VRTGDEVDVERALQLRLVEAWETLSRANGLDDAILSVNIYLVIG
jgi:hypothetical protein